MVVKQQEALAKAKQWLKSSFVSGLVVVAPLGLTLYVLHWLVSSADQLVETLPDAVWPEALQQVPGLGLVAALIVVMLAGAVARNLAGRWILTQVGAAIEHIPVVASIHRLMRQIAEAFLAGGQTAAFKRVVLVEWPRRDIWILAFVTSEVPAEMAARLGGGHHLNLFVPTAPNPTGGFHFIAATADCRESGLSVEAAFKVVISGGALLPEAAVSPATTVG